MLHRWIGVLSAAAVGAVVGAAAAYWMFKPDQRREWPQIAKRIILVRHGESMGNVDKTVYSQIPDHLVPLTDPRGKHQARNTGHAIKKIIGDGPVVFYVSPYERTRGTFREIRSALVGCKILKVREETRIREQDFGNFQDTYSQDEIEKKRNKYGRFFYRIPEGESGADVMDRVSSFFDTLYRSFKRRWFDPESTVIIVTHGLTLRLFLTRYFHWSVELFERTKNPANAAFVVMERVIDEHGAATYKLTPESASVIGLTEAECEADLAEDADRHTVGRPDIHLPAVACSIDRPMGRHIKEEMERIEASPRQYADLARYGSDSPASFSGRLQMQLAMERDVLPTGESASSALFAPSGEAFKLKLLSPRSPCPDPK